MRPMMRQILTAGLLFGLTGVAGAGLAQDAHPPLPMPDAGPVAQAPSSSVRLDPAGDLAIAGDLRVPAAPHSAPAAADAMPGRVISATGTSGPVGDYGPDALASSSVRLDDGATGFQGAPTRNQVMGRSQAAHGSNMDLVKQILFGVNTVPRQAGPGPVDPMGRPSNADPWRAIRMGDDDLRISARGPQAQAVIQTSGMEWLAFRKGPLAHWGGWLLAGTLVVLALFYLFRGRIMIDGQKTGTTIQRFDFIERFSHWLMAGSFLLLGITGLFQLFGRLFILPLIGGGAFDSIYVPMSSAGKWIHNNVSWAFMIGLVMTFVMWVAHNIPNRLDWAWVKQAGGLFSKNLHPPAKKFNAGQKLVFWSVVLLGASVSVSGLELLFPMQFHIFGHTFEFLNATGIPQLLGMGELPGTAMSWQQEMQLAQAWHAIVAMLFMAIILAHIYIGSVGMEGAFDAMGSGQVDEQWAREHHSLWYEEAKDAEARTAHPHAHRAPAE